MPPHRSLRKPRDSPDFPEIFVFSFRVFALSREVLATPEPRRSLRVLRELRVRYLLRPPAAPSPPRAGARTSRPPRTLGTQTLTRSSQSTRSRYARLGCDGLSRIARIARIPHRCCRTEASANPAIPPIFPKSLFFPSASSRFRVRFSPRQSRAGVSASSANSACDISCAHPLRQPLRVPERGRLVRPAPSAPKNSRGVRRVRRAVAPTKGAMVSHGWHGRRGCPTEMPPRRAETLRSLRSLRVINSASSAPSA